MIEYKLFEYIAVKIAAIENCKEKNNLTWEEKHSQDIEKLNQILPSGSGFDSGSFVNLDESTPDKIVINSSYHAMDENGFYCGWFYFQVVITPSLAFKFNLDLLWDDSTPDDLWLELVNLGDDSEFETWEDFSNSLTQEEKQDYIEFEKSNLADYILDAFHYFLEKTIIINQENHYTIRG